MRGRISASGSPISHSGYETEADRYGLDFLARAGIDTDDYAAILRTLQEARGKDGTPGFLSSHSSTAVRIEQAEGMKTNIETDQVPK